MPTALLVMDAMGYTDSDPTRLGVIVADAHTALALTWGVHPLMSNPEGSAVARVLPFWAQLTDARPDVALVREDGSTFLGWLSSALIKISAPMYGVFTNHGLSRGPVSGTVYALFGSAPLLDDMASATAATLASGTATGGYHTSRFR